MAYEFPILEHLDQIMPLVENRDDFIAGPTGNDFILVDYKTIVGDTFVSYNPEETALLRECRGLLFHNDGTVARRAFHKFFNLNEMEETHLDRLAHIQPVAIMEKLDGSMIAPFVWPGSEEIYWASMRGSRQYHEKIAALYDESVAAKLVREVHDAGQTAIFEYCSPDNRIVVEYDEPRLVLTAIRNRNTGVYQPYEQVVEKAQEFDVPVVGLMPLQDQTISSVAEEIWTTVGAEGAVVRFEDGTLTKLKGEWYVQLHKLLTYFEFEKDVAWLILREKEDDLMGILTPERRQLLSQYRDGLRLRLLEIEAETMRWCERVINENMDRKTFATLPDGPIYVIKHMMFRHFEDLSLLQPGDEIKKNALNNTSRGVKWDTFKKANQISLTWDVEPQT